MKTFFIIYLATVIFSLVVFVLQCIITTIRLNRLKKEGVKLKGKKNTIEAVFGLIKLSLLVFIPLFNIIIAIGLICKGEEIMEDEIDKKISNEEYDEV